MTETANTTHGQTTDIKPYGEKLYAQGMPLIVMQGVFGPLIATRFAFLFGFSMHTAILDDTIMSTFDALHTHEDTAEMSLRVVQVGVWNALYSMREHVPLQI